MQLEQFRVLAEVESDHWWHCARREILLALASDVLGKSDATVLDVGCATGGNTAAFADAFPDTIGIDPTETAIEFARQRFPRVRFMQGKLGDAEIDKLVGEVDLVLLADVLEHVEDDRGLLRSIIERLRPSAHLLLTVPADMRLWSGHDESHGHYRRYYRLQLEELWAGLPVETRLVSYFNSRLDPMVRVVRLVNRWLSRTSGPAGTDLGMPPRWLNETLRRVFAGERSRLLRVLRGEAKLAYRRGVSLIAVLRRERVPKETSGPISSFANETSHKEIAKCAIP